MTNNVNSKKYTFIKNFRSNSPLKMKGDLLLIGLLVCISMIEASSVRRARNQLKVIQNRQLKKTVARGEKKPKN